MIVEACQVHYRLTPARSPLTPNGEAAWRRRGGHYRLLEPQTVKFPTKGYLKLHPRLRQTACYLLAFCDTLYAFLIGRARRSLSTELYSRLCQTAC